MSYDPTVFVDDSTPAIDASELNKIGTGIQAAASTADSASASVAAAQSAASAAQTTANAAVPLLSTRTAASTVLQSSLLAGDANPAFKLTGDGKIQWGPGGASALDTNLYRSATGAYLKTDGQLWAVAGIGTKWKAGIPTDSDVIDPTALGWLILDNTNKRLYVRTGSGWQYATLT